MRVAALLCYLAATVVFGSHGIDHPIIEQAWAFALAAAGSAIYVMD